MRKATNYCKALRYRKWLKSLNSFKIQFQPVKAFPSLKMVWKTPVGKSCSRSWASLHSFLNQMMKILILVHQLRSNLKCPQIYFKICHCFSLLEACLTQIIKSQIRAWISKQMMKSQMVWWWSNQHKESIWKLPRSTKVFLLEKMTKPIHLALILSLNSRLTSKSLGPLSQIYHNDRLYSIYACLKWWWSSESSTISILFRSRTSLDVISFWKACMKVMIFSCWKSSGKICQDKMIQIFWKRNYSHYKLKLTIRRLPSSNRFWISWLIWNLWLSWRKDSSTLGWMVKLSPSQSGSPLSLQLLQKLSKLSLKTLMMIQPWNEKSNRPALALLPRCPLENHRQIKLNRALIVHVLS